MSDADADGGSTLGVENHIDRRVLEALETRLDRNVNDYVTVTVSSLQHTNGAELSSIGFRKITVSLERLAKNSQRDPRDAAGMKIGIDESGSRNRYSAYYAPPSELSQPEEPEPEPEIDMSDATATTAAETGPVTVDMSTQETTPDENRESDGESEAEDDDGPYADTPDALDAAIRAAGLGDAGDTEDGDA